MRKEASKVCLTASGRKPSAYRLPPALPGLGVELPEARHRGEAGVGERVGASDIARAAGLVVPDAVDT